MSPAFFLQPQTAICVFQPYSIPVALISACRPPVLNRPSSQRRDHDESRILVTLDKDLGELARCSKRFNRWF